MPNNQYGTRPDGVDEAEYSHLTPAVGNDNNLAKNLRRSSNVHRSAFNKSSGLGGKKPWPATVNKWPRRQLNGANSWRRWQLILPKLCDLTLPWFLVILLTHISY